VCAVLLANEIRHSKLLTKLGISCNDLCTNDWDDGQPKTTLAGTDKLLLALSGNKAITSVNLLGMELGNVSNLIQVMGSNKSLSTLYGFSGDEKDLDLTRMGS
jgi:hypothetical protein